MTIPVNRIGGDRVPRRMYPLTDRTLRLPALAGHWARDLPQRPAPDQVLDLLLRAFWRGDLDARLPDAEGPDPDARRRLLEACARFPDHPGLLFVGAPGEAPPAVVRLPDGSAEVDMRVRVAWPAAPEARTAEAFRAACHALAGAPFGGFSGLARPALACLAVHQDAFAAFRHGRGYRLPAFWFAREAAASSAGAATRFRRWLRAEVAAGHGKRLPKGGYLAEAQARFPGLSQRSFAEAWEEVVPAGWRRRGRAADRRAAAGPAKPP